MIEVFKTNVEKENDAQQIIQNLLEHFPGININFDLDDCDKILRVQGTSIHSKNIIELLGKSGYQCEILAGQKH